MINPKVTKLRIPETKYGLSAILESGALKNFEIQIYFMKYICLRFMKLLGSKKNALGHYMKSYWSFFRVACLWGVVDFYLAQVSQGVTSLVREASSMK